MWIRKSDLEINNLIEQKELRRNSLFRPILIGIGFGLFAMIVHYLGYRGGSLQKGVIFFSDPGFTRQTILFGILGFVFSFLFQIYRQQRGWSLTSEESLLRCDRCKEISQINIEKRCSCGGKLEPSEYFTWEEA